MPTAAWPRGLVASLLLVSACFDDPAPSEDDDGTFGSTGAADGSTGRADASTEDGTSNAADPTDGGSAPSSTGDDGPADASTGGSTGDEPPPNTLLNGSFEDWLGGAPVGWVPTGEIAASEATDDPYDGVSVARFEAGGYGELRQAVDLPEPVPAGGTVAAEMAYRYLEGDATPPGIDLFGTTVGGREILLPPITTASFSPDGWTIGGGAVVVDEELVALRITIVAGGVGPQTLEVDAARLWIEP